MEYRIDLTSFNGIEICGGGEYGTATLKFDLREVAFEGAEDPGILYAGLSLNLGDTVISYRHPFRFFYFNVNEFLSYLERPTVESGSRQLLSSYEGCDLLIRQVGLSDDMFCSGVISSPSSWKGQLPAGFHEAVEHAPASYVQFVFKIDREFLHRTRDQVYELKRAVAELRGG